MKHINFWQSFVAAAVTYPDNLAIASENETVTYDELLHRVYAYLEVLNAAEVKKDMPVAIMLQRDSNLLVAMLAVLALGAHYIPLDINHPAKRTEDVLKDSECQFIITNSAGSLTSIHILPPPTGAKSATLPFACNHEPQQLAYIIYTSGSTGKPKGVMITHANLSAFLAWGKTQYSKEDLAYVLAATSICFDLSIFECLFTLTQGGCVVLVSHALSLIDNAPNYPITLINTVPSAIEALLLANAVPNSVQVINLAGEALTQTLVNELYAKTNAQKIYNLYGPTETTTYSTSYFVTKNLERTMAPIGHAITGTQILLLDKFMHHVPKLMRGEIYITGLGVTHGYKNLAEETTARFVEVDIFGKKVRAYRTGDLARINQDGELEYLGRVDHQIKIRGFRIEPDEIVHALKQHAAVTQAYVMVNEDRESELIAYVVANSQDESLIEQLKAHLAALLPIYMVPYHFIMLDKLPLNQNGKIDRALLPKPLKVEVVQDFHSDIEQELATIWSTLLKHNSFARDDNFFYAGGHSLLAARLQANIQDVFHISLKLEDIFNYPTLTMQANLIFKEQQADNKRLFSFEIAPRPENIPMSFGQQRIWYQQWAEPTIPISNIPILITLYGELNVAAFDKSINTLIKRHEILRTTYHSKNFNLIQQIESEWSFATEVINCQTEELSGLLDKEANRAFDLEHDLMIRSKLFKVLASPKQYLMITQHHIASDAWSLNILMHEISVLYKYFITNQTLNNSDDIPALPASTAYADYSCWQRMNLDASLLKEELEYWRNVLKDAPDFIRLPYDKPRPEGTTYNGEFYEWEIPKELLNSLQQLALQQGTTLFVVLLAAFNALLFHYTRQTDFCIGILTANRPFKSLENTLGFFVNTLVLRNQFDSKIGVKQLLQRTKQNALQALQHQQLPFDKLVEALHPNRQGSRHPYFQVLFSLQNVLENELELDNLEIEVASYDRKIAKFDLTLSFFKKREALAAIFEFNTNLFYRETIARMVENYFEILKSMVKSQELTVGEMNIIPQNQSQYWLSTFNATTKDNVKSKTIVDCFDESVRNFPQKIALISGDSKLTYNELDARANQLAHYLKQQGVNSRDGVALLLPRGIDIIISQLAVLKLGAFYVPMDPAWPMQRLDFMLSDVKAKVILSTSQNATNLPMTRISVCMLNELSDVLNSMPRSALTEIMATDDACYVMYTSGSTGKPKGVIALHQGVVRLVKETNYVKLDENKTLLQLSQLAFDGSTFDIWGALLNGGTLVLMPEGLPVLQSITDLINAHAVNTLFVTTQLFNALVEHRLEFLKPLKQVLFGGDVASMHHVSVFKNTYPECDLSNIYGPTECTTYALSYLIPDNFDLKSSLPIGKPISNTSAVILSEDMQLVPVNVPGEIYIGGPGLAKGYLNDPVLTNEKFIKNPFKEIDSEYLYRTQDLGSYSEDLNIVFLGRVDNQIKLRGYRIELNEIEQAMRDLDEIKDVVVVIQKPEDLLVAYVIAQDNFTPNLQMIKHKLASRLPSYMLPDALEVLNEYPLTVNGKIDKQQLPRYELMRQELDDDCLQDKELGVKIRDIWVQVLDDEEVTYQDNFFEIGGNSLKIVHILERLQITFSDEPELLNKLDITTLFQYPSIQSLVQYLAAIKPTNDDTSDKKNVIRTRNKRKDAMSV